MIKCPICGSDDLFGWGWKNGYPLYRCQICDHIFADISKKSLSYNDPHSFREFITNELVHSDQDYYEHLCLSEIEGSHLYSTSRIIMHEISAFNFESKLWLDIGCGSGFLLSEIKKIGWTAIGIEPGGWGRIAAKQKSLNIIEGFLTKKTFNIKFDVISATDVLEHQSNPKEFLKLIKIYLKPEGLALFSIPFADSFHGKFLKARWSMVTPPTHSQFFTKTSLQTIIESVGLIIVKIIQFNSSYSLFNKSKKLKLLADKLLTVKYGGDQIVVIAKLKV